MKFHALRPTILLQRDSYTAVFLGKLPNFSQHPYFEERVRIDAPGPSTSGFPSFF